MSIYGRDAVQHAALMLVQRGLQGLGGLVFAVVVPRMMGRRPTAYVIGRYMPRLVLRDEGSAIRQFAGNLLTVRFLGSGLAASLYIASTAVALVELDRVLLWLIAGSVWIQGVRTLCFALFLGLNRADLWGARDTIRRWLTVLLVPLGVWLGGLRGAGVALIVTEVTVAALGICWIPLRPSWMDLRPDPARLASYLRFGLIFFGSQLLFAAFQAGGEVLVRAVSGEYVEVAYFALAHSVCLTAAASLPPLAWSFAPLLSGLLEGGDVRALSAWIERLLTWLAVTGIAAVLGCLFLGDAVTPLVFGAAYAPVAANLVPLSLGLLLQGLGTVTSLVALVYGRPGEALVASTVRLAAFWALGVVLVTWWGSWGACLAVAGASAVQAAYSAWRMRVALGGCGAGRPRWGSECCPCRSCGSAPRSW